MDQAKDTLWLRFAEDTSLPDTLTKAQQEILNSIFNATDANSLWSQALDDLGLHPKRKPNEIIKWFDHYPYINWSYMSLLLSGGTVHLNREKDNTFQMEQKLGVIGFFRLLQIHWKLSSYLSDTLKTELPENTEDRVRQSLSLGIALLGLQQRLNIHDEKELAKALQNPSILPAQQQETIKQIASIQKRRTSLSSAWEDLLSISENQNKNMINRPPYFWNTPENAPKPNRQNAEKTEGWNGTGVCGKAVSGKIMVIDSLKELPAIATDERPLILVFQYAKADTIRLFSKTDGILYCNGGALSHACTIAREQNMPCITGLGNHFWKEIKARSAETKELWVEMNPQTGDVKLKD